MKEPLRVPFEAAERDLGGPRLVHETGGDEQRALPSFCEELREARTRGGYSISDAAHVLRIQEHYLEALEEGRFDRIPGTTYAIGFLRSYSGFLGLDPDEIVDAFKREQGLEKGEQRLAFPSPSDTSPRPKFWLILLVLVLAGLAYGGWQYQSTGGQVATDLVEDVSTRLTEAVGMGESGAPEETAAASQTAAVTAGAPADAEPATETTAEPAVETAAAPAATVVTDEAPPAPPEPAPAVAQAEPAPAATRQEDPAPAAPAPSEPAAPAVASADLIPAAEVWDETGAAQVTEVVAPERSQAEELQVQPAVATVEAAAEVTPAVPEPTAPAEPAQTADVAVPSEPVTARAETSDRGSPIAAPLELAVVAVGGTSSATAGGEEAVASEVPSTGESTVAADTIRADTVSDTPAAPATSEPVIDSAPEQTAAVLEPAEAEPEVPVDTSYVPKAYGRSNLDARVVITAVDDSWVQIQGPDNELLLTRILHPGDTYRVPDRPGLLMVTGNAGGLQIQVDDAPAPALGPLGVVIRNIALDPDRLLAGTAIGG